MSEMKLKQFLIDRITKKALMKALDCSENLLSRYLEFQKLLTVQIARKSSVVLSLKGMRVVIFLKVLFIRETFLY